MARFLLLLSTLGAILGCEGGNDAIQVTGVVKFADGSPVVGESGTVVFHPTAEGKSASATIESDGSFTAMTEKPGDGMQPGAYKVTLHVFKNYREQTLAIPEKYAEVSTTPLSAAVSPDQTHFDFTVEP
jgi:hypothetical protein